MKRHPSPKHSAPILHRFAISYLVLMIIPLLMALIAYSIALHNSNEELMKRGQLALERAASEVECSVQEAREFVATLSSMPTVTALIDQDMNGVSGILHLQSAVGVLPEFKDTFRLFQRYFVYIPKSGISIDNRNAYIQMQDYYNSSFSYGGMTLEEFRQKILEAPVGMQLKPAMENTYLQRSYRSLLYTQLMVSPGRNLGRVLFYLDAAKLIDLLRTQCGEEASFIALYDNTGELLLSSQENMPVAYAELPESKRSGYLNVSSKKRLVSFCRSDLLDATFVVGMPQSYVTRQLIGVSTTMAGGMGLMLIIGCICAVWIMQSNRKPLMAALENLPLTDGEKAPSSLWQLAYAVRGLSDSHEQLEAAITQQQYELQNAACHLVIHGSGKSEEEMEALLKHVGIHLDGDWFRAVYLHLSSEDQWNEGMTAQGDLRRTMLMQLLSEIDPALVFMGFQSQNDCAMVYIGQDDEKTDDKLFSRVYRTLLENGGTAAVISIGPVRHHLTTLHYSFSIAAQQLERGNDGSWLLSYESQNEADSYHYTFHDEQRLGNLAANGKQKEIKEILSHLWHENFEKRHVTGMQREILFYRMADTLLSADASKTLISQEEQHRLCHMSPNAFFQKLETCYVGLCKQMDKQREQSSDRLIKEVLAYLEEHFADYETCLTSVSMYFGLTEKYFSAFFKEKTGTNFSNRLEDLRIDQADDLLQHSQCTVEEVAIAVGYSSAKTFSRAYHRCRGRTPTQTRKQFKQ